MRIRTKIPVIDAVIVLTEKIGSWLERYRIRVLSLIHISEPTRP